MAIIEIKSATITGKGQIAIPRNMRKLKGFKTGSKIAIMAFEDHVELRPLEQVSEKLETAVASEKSLEKDWNSKEDDKAWKNL
ncbi:AbrB/MazE/SpoVT family DNA-binding domain-containing protein [Candidatus Woesearchaeota archaeon]|nr:AbrB/MazE/SpoVT family DNA-binding domain-containing protein [Candidatus Woesearchaeota archaeon]